ncbi:MAG: protein translocase subunit SecF [Phycisphaerales bacterium]|nr:protein translocase subunit SecF [Phycisphaerales bacterium]
MSPEVSPAFDVSDYLGGSVVVVGDMNPAATLADVTNRINRMRSQPNYEKLGYRQFEVVGLDPAGQNDVRSGEPLYKSVAVVSKDNSTSYIENPDTFGEEGGLAATEWAIVRDALLRDTSLGSITNFSSQVSDTMKQQATVAVILSWIAIALYVWVRFGNLRYGFGAIAALVHDVLIAVGLAALATYVVGWAPDTAVLLGLEPFHLNLSMVAAVLTLIGYSVNDTIVTFDRIRENRGRLSWATPQIINDSINQTLSRTILTGGTVFISVLLLYAIGGPGVHNFAFVMLVGTVVGTYSSIVIAAPILLLGAWGKIAQEQAETADDSTGLATRE